MSIATEQFEDLATDTANSIEKTIGRYKAFDTYDLSPDQRFEHYGRLASLETIDEQDICRIARRMAARRKRYPFDPKVSAIHRLRVNVKSLAAEARAIRQEERRCGIQYFFELNHHRRFELRLESRLAHLAIAFIRGQDRCTVDRLKEGPSGWDFGRLSGKLHAKISRFYTATQEDVDKWLRG